MKKFKQHENKESGIFHMVNGSDKVQRESPGGYFIEKSRKTELYRLKAKEDVEFHKIEEKKLTWWEKIKAWFV